MKKLSSYLQIFRSHLYHQFFTDELFKLLSLDQFLCADEKHERAVGRSQHTVDLVDADVAVLCRLLGGQCHFQMDRNGADAIFPCKISFLGFISLAANTPILIFWESPKPLVFKLKKLPELFRKGLASIRFDDYNYTVIL